ncbi:MAG: UPF0335 protein [Candidatus Mesenet longicola]|uniref:UPF0335 protein sL5_07650 n=1 Tax=Candidatus Mesenet longicola TaxID=1892558 RepID=A0A8J3MQP5_9RICK|nr:MAG: UPF0335 protein [Candidatus Mesenet longicola]GHM59772.1 MAG: UPF0335 protein [Candidatus Mesenet longicola]
MEITDTINVVPEELKSYIERIEKLELEKKEMQDHVRDVYAEAADKGFDPKIMKEVIKLRKMENDDREEQEMLLDTYQRALGMKDHCE